MNARPRTAFSPSHFSPSHIDAIASFLGYAIRRPETATVCAGGVCAHGEVVSEIDGVTTVRDGSRLHRGTRV